MIVCQLAFSAIFPSGWPRFAVFWRKLLPMDSLNASQVDPRFAARVARIQEARAKPVPAAPKKRELPTYSLSLVAAFLIGIFVVFAARYARFHLTGTLPGAAADASNTLVMDFGMAFLAGFVLQQVFNFKRPEHIGAKSFGMGLGAFTMHMPVHLSPGLFSILFSEAWVNQVLRVTEATKPGLF